MIKLTWNLSFNGRCEEAFKFYEKTLGGKIQLRMTWGESPMAKDVGPEWADKITHISMTLGQQVLTGGDSPNEHYERPQGFSVLLDVSEAAEAERLFKTLGEGGTVKMPLAETFWAKKFGMVTDRFGTPWMVNCGKPM